MSLKNDFAIKPQGIATALGSNFVTPSNAIVFPTSLFVIIGSQSPYACVNEITVPINYVYDRDLT